MVIVIPNATREVDFVILTSIHYALARVGGPVVEYKTDLDVTGEKKICISGHGEVGSVQGHPAIEIANMLADPHKGCRDTLERLILTCCYAGCRIQSVVGTAVIDALAANLKIKDMPIQGAMGPSIKANVLGEAYRVIDETKTAKSGKTGHQEEHLKITGNAKLADLVTGENRQMSFDKIMKKVQSKKRPHPGKSYIEYKAERYANMSENFFINFVEDLEQDGLLFDSKSNMNTVYWDGSKVVDGLPGVGKDKGKGKGKSQGCCYLTTATVRSLGLPDDCGPLTTLRRFRDEVLLGSPAGARAVAEYYATAPGIVAAIDQLPDSAAIYQEIFDHRIAPAVAAIRQGRYPEAIAIYQRLVLEARACYLGLGGQ
jgi:hypothetical protein